jgi:hypothetical protein
MGPPPRGRVDIHSGNPRSREGLDHDPLDLLGAEATIGEFVGSATGTLRGRFLLVPAVVAAKVTGAPVEGEGDRAVRTLDHLATFAALHERRIPATVEKEDDLLGFRDPISDRGDKACGEDPTPLLGRTPLFRMEFAEVDDLYGRRRPPFHPLMKSKKAKLSLAHISPTLERRGGAPQNADRPGEVGTDHGHIAGLIPRSFGLLVGAVVLLVHDDRAEIRERCKEGRTRADDDVLLPPPDLPPLIVAFPGREGRMEDGDLFSEPGPEAGDRLRSQRDFGNQDDRRPSLPSHDLLQEFDVDKGLPRAGDAMEEEGGWGIAPVTEVRLALRGGGVRRCTPTVPPLRSPYE